MIETVDFHSGTANSLFAAHEAHSTCAPPSIFPQPSRRAGSREVTAGAENDEIVGESQALKAALNLVSLAAPTDCSVLILGETGTGKELVARAVHRLSCRREKPFVKLNCAAIPAGL